MRSLELITEIAYCNVIGDGNSVRYSSVKCKAYGYIYLYLNIIIILRERR